jgi:uncharacterized protein DUF6916
MLTRRRFTYTLMGLVTITPRRSGAASPADPNVAAPGVSLEGPLNREVFRALVREEFSLLLANRPATTLRLLRVEDDAARPGGGQFMVVFQGAPELNLAEGSYRVAHATAGTALLYLRPRGRDDRYSYYEAPFNLLPENAPVTAPPVRERRRLERPLYTPGR